MAVNNIKSRPTFLWIPPTSKTSFKLTIEYADGTVEDITNRITDYEVEDHITESIGQFEFNIWDPNEKYYNTIVGNEIFRYYKEYTSPPTSIMFRGRVEKPSKRGNKLNVKGRGESLKILNVTVTASYAGIGVSTIFNEIFQKYLPGFTLNNVNTSDTTLTVNWYQKPLFDCIKELCSAAGFEWYLDGDLDNHFFESGSINNDTDAIVHTYNMVDIEDFMPDLQLIRNRVIVYGALQQGIQIIATAESDDASYGVNSSLGVKEEIVNDDNITNQTQAQETANFILADLINPPEIGSIIGIMIATLKPGENIRLSSPSDGIEPAYYNSTGYVDTFSTQTGKYQTKVFINKEPRLLSHIIKTRVENENKLKQTSINPEEMKFSYNHLFDSNSGNHTNTEITDGVLKPTTTSGTWLSDNIVLTSNLSEAYLIMNGETLTGAVVSISGNNGITYQAMSNRTKLTISSAIGSNIRIKVVFSSADTQIDSIGILYNK